MSRYSLFLVIAQFFLMGFLALNTNIFPISALLIVQILGVLLAIWGILTLRVGNFNVQPEVKSSSLIISGPYRWVRNPMYLGILMIFGPPVISNTDLINWLAFALLISILLLKIIREETLLLRHFGAEYSDYAATSKRLIPYLY